MILSAGFERCPYCTRLITRDALNPTAECEADCTVEVWIPPTSDCMNYRHDPPCPHCASTVFHHRTGRCGKCGRRP